MHRLFILIFSFGSASFAFSQSTNFQADLDKLYFVLKATPSYKDQIVGKKRITFDSLYKSLGGYQTASSTSFENFNRLAKLFFLINDNHLGFYQFPSIVLPPKDFKNDSAIKAYRQSTFNKDYPRININLDSL